MRLPKRHKPLNKRAKRPLRCKLGFHKIKRGWGWEGPECELCGSDVVESR